MIIKPLTLEEVLGRTNLVIIPKFFNNPNITKINILFYKGKLNEQ